MIQNSVFAVNHGFGEERHPQAGRIVVNAITEESGRGNSNDGDRMRLNIKSFSDYCGVPRIIVLPRLITENCHWRGARIVVGGEKRPAQKWADAKCRKVIA